jgi:N-acetylglucosaminyldiphosphoundecaprenol N-acetyl-beta-D-mannosaminyltransferase
MEFCNIDFKVSQRKELFKLDSKELPKCIIPVNAQVIVLANNNERLMRFINKQWAVFDGQVPLIKAKKINKEFDKYEKLSGSDMVYDFCSFALENDKKVFFLGGEHKSNEMAVKNIMKKYKGIDIKGFSPEIETYPFSKKFVDSCLYELNIFKPDILFVGYGAPKQEFFIEDNYEFFKAIGIKYVISCGGTFDFVSGKLKRAPKWIQNIGLEGLYRLLKQFSWMRVRRLIESFQFYKYIKN